MTAPEIIAALARPGAEAAESADGMPTIVVAREDLVEVSRGLRESPALGFSFLADITCTDYHPREPRFEVIYLLACLGVAGFGDTPKRLRMKVRLPGADVKVPSVSSVWPAAGWAERELYDLFGVIVTDHPDLRRILMPEDWEGYPLRKDYPVQIKQAVRLSHPLQVSEEQFVANIQAARDRVRKD
jgi:NADH-quinone oxidoreductase subunit C